MSRKKITPELELVIIETYKETRSTNATARVLGYGQTSILRVLAKHKVNTDGLEHWREQAKAFSDKECHGIRSEYDAGAPSSVLAKKYDVSIYTIKNAIGRAGGAIRPNPAPEENPEDVAKVRELHAIGMSQVIISLEMGRSQSFVARLMRRHGIEPRVMPRGDAHGRWKGGRYQKDGYWKVLVAKDHPMAEMADSSGYALEHRLVKAIELGRPLSQEETVHHIDGDGLNNHPSNLQLRQGRHGKHVVMTCNSCGSCDISVKPIADQAD